LSAFVTGQNADSLDDVQGDAYAADGGHGPSTDIVGLARPHIGYGTWTSSAFSACELP
jgi:hypothetical protein